MPTSSKNKTKGEKKYMYKAQQASVAQFGMNKGGQVR